MSDSVLRTASDDSTLSPVVGQMPALATEAAMTDAGSDVTCNEQHYSRNKIPSENLMI